jgi:hypothetical protein
MTPSRLSPGFIHPRKGCEKAADCLVASLTSHGLSGATNGEMNDLLIAEMELRDAYARALKRIHSERRG